MRKKDNWKTVVLLILRYGRGQLKNCYFINHAIYLVIYWSNWYVYFGYWFKVLKKKEICCPPFYFYLRIARIQIRGHDLSKSILLQLSLKDQFALLNISEYGNLQIWLLVRKSFEKISIFSYISSITIWELMR